MISGRALRIALPIPELRAQDLSLAPWIIQQPKPIFFEFAVARVRCLFTDTFALFGRRAFYNETEEDAPSGQSNPFLSLSQVRLRARSFIDPPQ